MHLFFQGWLDGHVARQNLEHYSSTAFLNVIQNINETGVLILSHTLLSIVKALVTINLKLSLTCPLYENWKKWLSIPRCIVSAHWIKWQNFISYLSCQMYFLQRMIRRLFADRMNKLYKVSQCTNKQRIYLNYLDVIHLTPGEALSLKKMNAHT